MLNLFFIIVLIAVVIVTNSAVSCLRRLDAKVCEVNKKVKDYNSILELQLKLVSIQVKKVSVIIGKIVSILDTNKNNYKKIILKAVLPYIVCLLLKIPAKYVSFLVDSIFIIRNFYK